MLSVDHKKCDLVDEEYDTNCADVVIPKEQEFCSVCRPGHYFKEDKCVEFEENNFDSGCFSTDPKHEDICHLCRSGFYMNKEGDCTIIAEPIIEPIGETDSILHLWNLMVLIFIFIQ